MSRIDFRSDLLSKPGPEVAEAVVKALAGAAQFGLREDPHQVELERRTAELLGTEDALLFPTCTMANQVAILLHTRPGDAVLTQAFPHVLTSEAGGAAANAGVQAVPVGDSYRPALAQWTAALQARRDTLKPPPGLVALENTHTQSGGRVLPVDYVHAVVDAARAEGVPVHLDGARLFNAAVATGASLRELCAGMATVSINFNKGLGAPTGAALAGSRAVIARALGLRHRLGGGLRPTHMIAAAALAALRDTSHIAEDHRRAKRLEARLQGVARVSTQPQPVESNIVFAAVEGLTAQALGDWLAARGILVLPVTATHVRFVTCRGIVDADIDEAATALRAIATEH